MRQSTRASMGGRPHRSSMLRRRASLSRRSSCRPSSDTRAAASRATDRSARFALTALAGCTAGRPRRARSDAASSCGEHDGIRSLLVLILLHKCQQLRIWQCRTWGLWNSHRYCLPWGPQGTCCSGSAMRGESLWFWLCSQQVGLQVEERGGRRAGRLQRLHRGEPAQSYFGLTGVLAPASADVMTPLASLEGTCGLFFMEVNLRCRVILYMLDGHRIRWHDCHQVKRIDATPYKQPTGRCFSWAGERSTNRP